jgi:hypothetical protein
VAAVSLGAKNNLCAFEDQIEFTIITPARIEGAVMAYRVAAAAGQ